MPINRLDGTIPVKTRDQVRDEWLKSFKLRQPAADTTTKSFPYILGSNHADGLMPIYAAMPKVADATSPLTARGEDLDREAVSRGRPRRPAVGAAGFVTVSTGAGGSSVVENDELKHLASGLRFRVIASDGVDNGDEIAIVGISTGPGTILAAGTKLRWTSPRPGMNDDCVVFEN